MVISASRRTDIPKFHAEWFMECVRAGSCSVRNPFDPRRVASVSLRPEDVDVIVFWSKDPEPLIRYLPELDRRGLRYYFLFTVNGYPPSLEPAVPPLATVLKTFERLSGMLSPERVVWRYDPIVLSNVTDPDYHEERFGEIARALRGRTTRVVVSLMDEYRATRRRLAELASRGTAVRPCTPSEPGMERLMAAMAAKAAGCGMDIVSCAEEYDLARFGIAHGACIDAEHIRRTFGIRVPSRKDPHQRPECRCIQARDIGEYGTCLHGCVYCYAGGVRPKR